MNKYEELELLDQTALTASANSAVFETSRSLAVSKDLVLYLDVTVATGTSPTLDITVQGMVDGKAYNIGTFAQKTTAGVERIVITDAPKDVRLDSVISGTTPSFDFKVTATRG